ncbi:hypothetical protein CsSME_00040148 [Camellia sinensis var. sinensis]
MSESAIKVYGALRMYVKMFLMWNSTMLIDGGGDANVETSLVEASYLSCSQGASGINLDHCVYYDTHKHSLMTCFSIFLYQESSVIHSNANLGVHGQGLLNLSGPRDCIEAQRLVLSLFYSIHVSGCLIIIVHFLMLSLRICQVEDILVEGCIERDPLFISTGHEL